MDIGKSDQLKGKKYNLYNAKWWQEPAMFVRNLCLYQEKLTININIIEMNKCGSNDQSTTQSILIEISIQILHLV